MEPNEVVYIETMELSRQKMNGDGDIRLEFYNKYIRYVCKFFAEEPVDREDTSLGWETIDNNFEIIISKRSIAGLEKYWDQKENHWRLYIYVDGMPEDVKVFFKTEAEIENLLNKLKPYLYD
jgi:hypothetical protein